MSRAKRDPARRRAICTRFAQLLGELEPNNVSKIAKKLGYGSPSTLYAVIKGDNLPDVDKLYRLGTECRYGKQFPNIDWVITGRGEMFIDTLPRSMGEGPTSLSPTETPPQTTNPRRSTKEYDEVVRALRNQPAHKLKALLAILG